MQSKTENEAPDGAALVLMLAYVEAECRRLGAETAATYAAMAAAMVPAARQSTARMH